MNTSKKIMWILGLWCAFWFVVIAIVGCAKPHDGPACAPRVLLSLEQAYVKEAFTACKAEGAKSLSTCKAAPAIREKYRLKRADYVECK